LSPSTARNWKYLCDIPSSWTACSKPRR
jgi:hypothetical protein